MIATDNKTEQLKPRYDQTALTLWDHYEAMMFLAWALRYHEGGRVLSWALSDQGAGSESQVVTLNKGIFVSQVGPCAMAWDFILQLRMAPHPT